MGNYDPEQDVRRALSRRMETGNAISVLEVLGPYAKSTWEYWSRVAEELHAHEAYYDASDAWHQAKTMIEHHADKRFYLEQIGTSLWMAFEATNDAGLAEAASVAFKEADCWSQLLFVKERTGCTSIHLLRHIEEALCAKFNFDSPDANSDWALTGTVDGYISFSSIKNWEALADAYLAVDEISGAFRAWAHLAEVTDPHEILRSSVSALTYQANKLGIELNTMEDDSEE